MALTINTEISGQIASNVYTYCYLYEPLRINVAESDPAATKLYVDIQTFHTDASNTQVEYLTKYAEYDMVEGVSINLDLMKIARQHHDAEVFKFSSISDLINGWQAVVSKYKYSFRIYTDVSSVVEVKKLPIIGGRMLEQFAGNEAVNYELNTEFDYYGMNANVINSRWSGYFSITTILTDPTNIDSSPTLTNSVLASGDKPCGGWLIWKSRFGGWMNWGFDLQTRRMISSYEGSLEVDMFESTARIGGSPFVPVDYTGINNSYSYNLKALALTQEELLAVSGIAASPAVYMMRDGNSQLELFRTSSISAPISSLANGGDFGLTLNSISKTRMKTK